MRQNRRKKFVSWNLIFDITILTIQPFPYLDSEVRFHEYIDDDGRNEIHPLYLLSDFLLL